MVSSQHVSLPGAGMTCTHCEEAVTEAVHEAGGRDASADFRRGQTVFTLPAELSLGDIQAAIRHTGYEPGAPDQPQPGIRPTPRSTAADYDLAIIGSGAASFAAAIKAQGLGARTIMIERGTIGGTCVNIGCIPSKTLIRASEVYGAAKQHPFAGIETHAGTVDLGTAVGQKNDLVASLRAAKYANLIDEYGWEMVTGEGDARFIDGETLTAGSRTIRAARYLIATGVRPVLPPLPGLAEAEPLTSTTALDLKQLPRSLVVIGAGYIALELGQLFHRLGTQVTLVQRGSQLLGDYEPEIGEAVRAMLEQDGVTVLTGTHVQRVERSGELRCLHVRVDGVERVLEAEQVLVATGRQPNTEALNLSAAGIETDQCGVIIVDAQLRTTNHRVFAAGDVTLAPQYVYVAAYQGGLAAENALTDANKEVDLTALPGVIFTDPQVATVGLTEAQARAAGFEVTTSVLPLSSVPRAQVNYEETGVFKLVADNTTGRVLGAHIAAGNASDVIYAATLAVKHHLTVTDLVESFAPYLTLAEGLKLAAVSFNRDVATLSCCAT